MDQAPQHHPDPPADAEGGPPHELYGPPEPGSQQGETDQNRQREIPPPPRKRPFVIAGIIAAALLGWGGYSHWNRNAAAAETQRKMESFVPQVRTAWVKRDDAPVPLSLPGETRPFETANIQARATGYVAERHVDIGSRVKKGDLLLRIAAPDLDQQLAQAEAQVGQMQAALVQANAQVGQAQANANLAAVTNARTATLATKGYETQQNADTTRANVLTSGANVEASQAGVKVAEANLAAQQATVRRLAALVAFETIRAPFDGVVTTRGFDVGDLVTADASSGTPLLSIDRDDILRVSVNVPQSAATGLVAGIPATMRVPQMPGREFKGTVSRSSSALLSSARTLTTEVDVRNPDGALRAGLFVTVEFAIPRTHPEVVVPAEALVFNQKGLQVATVRDERVRFEAVTIDRDQGAQVALRSGLNGDEQVVLSPPATLDDGAQIRIRRDDEQDKGKTQQASRDSATKPD